MVKSYFDIQGLRLASDENYTLLELSGRGILKDMSLYIEHSSTVFIEIIVDGVSITNISYSNLINIINKTQNGMVGNVDRTAILYYSSLYNAIIPKINISFNNNLVIKAKTTTNACNYSSIFSYMIED